MLIVVIINTIVCIIGVLGGLFVATGSVISIANMNVPWAVWLLVAAFLIPVMFGVSGIGAWITHWWGSRDFTLGMVALPWVYGLISVIAMLATFKTLSQ